MVSELGFQLVVFSREEILSFDLPLKGEVTIGRDETSNVRIDDPAVSRQHAVLRAGQTLELEDLGGANGTFVRRTAQSGLGNDTVQANIQKVFRSKASLAVGDCLLFGTACAVVRRAPQIEVPNLSSSVVVRESAMRTLYAEAERVARAPINILLLGETGVGKEVLARAIHAHSARAGGPFVGINCAALADSLLESELFGSEKGAFTGAVTRPGLFEAANGGTVFLDEVGELALGTQAKLLRVLEEREVTRLGATRPRAINVRFVAATNRDLEADSRQGRMRPDLYFRLNGASLLVPPLRERLLDIESLAASFLFAACRDLERTPPLSISSSTFDILRRYAWPGNVRELRNVIERAAVMCSERKILPEHLPLSLLAATKMTPGTQTSSSSIRPSDAPNLQMAQKSFERDRILEAIERCAGNQSEAARQLGMPRRTLVSRLTKLGLTRRRTSEGEA